MRHRDGTRMLAAAVAALAAMSVWSGAYAAEATIRDFPFGCETPGGQIVKPRHGDIDGVTYTDLPAQRQQCLGTIDRKIALCRENTEFESATRNAEFAACLPTFEKQARACIVHFTFERGKCGADDLDPDDDAASEQDELTTQELTPGGRFRVKPVERWMAVREAANARTGPGPEFDIVGTAKEGERLRVTGEVRGRSWVRVEFRGRIAFIYAPLLRAVAAETVETPETPETQETAETPAATASTAAATASPAPSGADWSITEDQPCEVWNYGNRDYEPFTWSGSCEEGKASGDGRLVFRGGEGVYEGSMLAGKMDGRGVLDWANGFRYEGELRDGKQHGYGILTQAGGDRYEGGWRNGRPHGHGVYTRADGSIFDGAWRDGCFGERDGRWATIGASASDCGFE